MKLPIRSYQIARLYGPGMPPSGVEGHHERVLEKPVGQVGLVLVHCWNLGEMGGLCRIEPGTRCPDAPADRVPSASEDAQ